MYVTLYFNGIPVNVSVEPTEPAAPSSVQGQIKALTSFTNHASGKAVPQDVKNAARAIRLSGNDR